MISSDRFYRKEKCGLSLNTISYVIVDKYTGVNYLYVEQGYSGGLTVLLDENGKPIISKENEKNEKKTL